MRDEIFFQWCSTSMESGGGCEVWRMMIRSQGYNWLVGQGAARARQQHNSTVWDPQIIICSLLTAHTVIQAHHSAHPSQEMNPLRSIAMFPFARIKDKTWNIFCIIWSDNDPKMIQHIKIQTFTDLQKHIVKTWSNIRTSQTQAQINSHWIQIDSKSSLKLICSNESSRMDHGRSPINFISLYK